MPLDLAHHSVTHLTSFVVLQRYTSANSHFAISSVRTLPTTLLYSLLRRQIPLRERHIFSLSAQISTPRHARPRQAPSPRQCLAHLALASEGHSLRSGQRSGKLCSRVDGSGRVPARCPALAPEASYPGQDVKDAVDTRASRGEQAGCLHLAAWWHCEEQAGRGDCEGQACEEQGPDGQRYWHGG